MLGVRSWGLGAGGGSSAIEFGDEPDALYAPRRTCSDVKIESW